jgi:hypothetical protein
MPRAVCIVSPGNLASNPRVIKEASALHDAGYSVTTVTCDYSEALRGEDDEITATAPWKVVRVKRAPEEGVSARVATTMAKALEAAGMTVPAGVAACSARAPVGPLTRTLRGIRADLYIAHYVAALPAAADAARRHGALLGFDAEDFHSGEGTKEPGEDFRMRMVEAVEGAVLPDCAYMTAASPMIGAAYAQRYGLVPTTVLNVFPLSMAPQYPQTGQRQGLKAYWFSQTIGLDRGLQAFIEAMARARTAVTLDIRGSNRWGHGEVLLALASKLGLEGRVRLLPMAPPVEMVRLAAEYDVGLSLETDVSENRRICLTNKIFTYLLAGIPVVMSETPAQVKLAPDLGAAARLCALDDPVGLASLLDSLGSPDVLARAAAEAWRLGREHYNWEKEQAVLLAAVAAAFDQPVGATGKAGH